MGLLDQAEAYIADKAAENEFAAEINKVTGGTDGAQMLNEVKGLAAGSSAAGGENGSLAEEAEDFAGTSEGKQIEEKLQEFASQ